MAAVCLTDAPVQRAATAAKLKRVDKADLRASGEQICGITFHDAAPKDDNYRAPDSA